MEWERGFSQDPGRLSNVVYTTSTGWVVFANEENLLTSVRVLSFFPTIN